MSEASKTILDIKNLDISFKTNAGIVHAIRGVNIDLCKGETVAIVGESGSGKSVTMKAASPSFSMRMKELPGTSWAMSPRVMRPIGMSEV